jgi:hypothetical protein
MSQNEQFRHFLQNRGIRLFFILAGFFIANAVVAEFVGVKIFSLERTLGAEPVGWMIWGGEWNFDISAGVLMWPTVFITTDLINEYFGRRGVRFLSWFTAILIAFAFIIVNGVIHLAPADWWPASQTARGLSDMGIAFNGIFGQGLGIIMGSLTAFLLAQLLDVLVFHQIKKVTGERWLWLRSTGSTVISQLIDTFVVTAIAFYFYPMLVPGNGEPWSLRQLMTVCIGGYIYKFTVAVLMTPLIYLIHDWIERYLSTDLAADMKRQAAEA